MGFNHPLRVDAVVLRRLVAVVGRLGFVPFGWKAWRCRTVSSAARLHDAEKRKRHCKHHDYAVSDSESHDCSLHIEHHYKMPLNAASHSPTPASVRAGHKPRESSRGIRRALGGEPTSPADAGSRVPSKAPGVRTTPCAVRNTFTPDGKKIPKLSTRSAAGLETGRHNQVTPGKAARVFCRPAHVGTRGVSGFGGIR